jgi:hypothetical protein
MKNVRRIYSEQYASIVLEALMIDRTEEGYANVQTREQELFSSADFKKVPKIQRTVIYGFDELKAIEQDLFLNHPSTTPRTLRPLGRSVELGRTKVSSEDELVHRSGWVKCLSDKLDRIEIGAPLQELIKVTLKQCDSVKCY